MKLWGATAVLLTLWNAQPTIAADLSCNPRKTCSKINTCEDAQWYLENCPWGHQLDRDSDGAPCEKLCGSND